MFGGDFIYFPSYGTTGDILQFLSSPLFATSSPFILPSAYYPFIRCFPLGSSHSVVVAHPADPHIVLLVVPARLSNERRTIKEGSRLAPVNGPLLYCETTSCSPKGDAHVVYTAEYIVLGIFTPRESLTTICQYSPTDCCCRRVKNSPRLQLFSA